MTRISSVGKLLYFISGNLFKSRKGLEGLSLTNYSTDILYYVFTTRLNLKSAHRLEETTRKILYCEASLSKMSKNACGSN